MMNMPSKAFLAALFFEKASMAQKSGLRRITESEPLLVDYVYTFGAPSTADPLMSNPGNKCIPGIRTFTEDISSGDSSCGSWWWWCNRNEHIESTDFAAQINNDNYPQPKMTTLILRVRDSDAFEYEWRECKDSDDASQDAYLWWPTTDQPAGMLPGSSGYIHDIESHYERRLMEVPPSIGGPLLAYSSVAKCGYETSRSKLEDCLKNYSSRMHRLSGIGPQWQVAAFMNHKTYSGDDVTDQDVVYVIKNDEDPSRRKCIINFMGSNGIGDVLRFVGVESTSYCGRHGVHTGVRNELWHITHDPDYQGAIKPALETCHELTCVGWSLGGSLCNLFTMCANQGFDERMMVQNDSDMLDDFKSLSWTKPRSENV
ncbi:hypothetical protein ACHAWF_017960 [Thalassiosira exigua]